MMWNQLKTIGLLGVLSVGFVALGGLLGPTYVYLFGALALALNFGAYFYSDRIVLRMSRAREVDYRSAPGLVRMVEALARNAEIPTPRIYILPQAQPNAFATGRNPEHGAVAVTEGLLQLLSERELRGVIAHELAHIKNRDILIASVAATIASAVTYIAHALQWSAIFGFGGQDEEDGVSPLGALALAFLAPVAATLIQLAISRSREFEADATGARIAGDPEGLARALEKLHYGAQRIPAHVEPATASLFIVSPLSGGSMASLFSTHPEMGDRIARLRAMPMSRGSRPVFVG